MRSAVGRTAGLVDVSADAYFLMASSACLELERTTTQQIRSRLLAAGLATDEMEQHLDNLSTGLLDLAAFPMITAWGRRP